MVEIMAPLKSTGHKHRLKVKYVCMCWPDVLRRDGLQLMIKYFPDSRPLFSARQTRLATIVYLKLDDEN